MHHVIKNFAAFQICIAERGMSSIFTVSLYCTSSEIFNVKLCHALVICVGVIQGH